MPTSIFTTMHAKELEFTNPFTLTHGYLSEARHSDVPENATFHQATGTMVAIKKFIETPTIFELPPGVTIVYTSTINAIADAMFQDLPERIETRWTEIIGRVKFDYLGEATADQWTQFFEQYDLLA